MCDVTLAALAISAATTASTIASQNAQYRSQSAFQGRTAEFQKEMFAKTVQGVREDVHLQTMTLYKGFDEQRRAVFTNVNNVANDAMKAAATTQASFSSSGIEGRTVDQEINEFAADFSRFAASRFDELSARHQQVILEAQGIRNRGQSIINSGVPQPMAPLTPPNPIPAILNGATTGIAVASSLNSLSPPPGSFNTAQQGAPSAGWSQFNNWYMSQPSMQPMTSFSPRIA